ncbi:MAG: hypothetical protein R3D66_00245 [Alphaproteobacteria bacterium]
MKIFGLLLCSIFLLSLFITHAICPSPCSGEQSIAYVLPFILGFTVLPLGLFLLIGDYIFKEALKKNSIEKKYFSKKIYIKNQFRPLSIVIELSASLVFSTLIVSFAFSVFSIIFINFNYFILSIFAIPFALLYGFIGILVWTIPAFILDFFTVKNRAVWIALGMLIAAISFYSAKFYFSEIFLGAKFDTWIASSKENFILTLAVAIGVLMGSMAHDRLYPSEKLSQ